MTPVGVKAADNGASSNGTHAAGRGSPVVVGRRLPMSPGEMIRMREAGFTYKEIAKKADIPWGTVRYRLQSWGIQPQEKIVHERNRKCKYLYPVWLLEMLYWDCQLSTVQIAYELDLRDETVCAIMARFGIKTRTRSQAQKLYAQRNPGARGVTAPTLTPERARAMARKSAAKRRKRIRSRDYKRERRKRDKGNKENARSEEAAEDQAAVA